MSKFTKLNQLEKRAFNAEESASEVRWQVADEIVRLLDSGETQQVVASGWINLKTGKPYSISEVSYHAQAARNFAAAKRGDFFEARQTIRPRDFTAERTTQLPKNEDGLVSVLTNVANQLYKHHEWTTSDIAAEVRDYVEPKTEGAKGSSKVEAKKGPTTLDLLAEILDLIARLPERLSGRAATKAEQAILALETKVELGIESGVR